MEVATWNRMFCVKYGVKESNRYSERTNAVAQVVQLDCRCANSKIGLKPLGKFTEE